MQAGTEPTTTTNKQPQPTTKAKENTKH
jgi:hypothetical protein